MHFKWPSWSGVALHWHTPPGQIAILNRERRVRVRMNVAAHQKKKENKNTGKGEAGEEEKQSTYFRKTMCSFL